MTSVPVIIIYLQNTADQSHYQPTEWSKAGSVNGPTADHIIEEYKCVEGQKVDIKN